MLAPKTARLLSLAAAVAVLPLLGLYGLLIKISSDVPLESGMEPTVTLVCRIAFTFLFGALLTVAVNFSMQLSREAKGERQTP